MLLNEGFFRYLFLKKKDKKFALALKNLLGFFPVNIHVYRQAFTHKSVDANKANHQKRPNNERLEFLGDAILGSVVADFLFRKYPYKKEGFLTEMRSRIVSRDNLGKLSRKMGLDKLIESDIKGGIQKSIYGDTFEAMIGAVYMDKGYNITRKFILKRIIETQLDITDLEQTDTNFKSRLLAYIQREKLTLQYNTVEEIKTNRGTQHVIVADINGTTYGKGVDSVKKKAEQLAAEKTIEMLLADGKDV